MKRVVSYRCDYCKFESQSLSEIEAHEAEHIGLSVSELHDWRLLQKNVQSCSAAVSITKNETTEKAFDDAVEKLMNFEKEHGLSHETEFARRNIC